MKFNYLPPTFIVCISGFSLYMEDVVPNNAVSLIAIKLLCCYACWYFCGFWACIGIRIPYCRDCTQFDAILNLSH
jgi:hypothetical protein